MSKAWIGRLLGAMGVIVLAGASAQAQKAGGILRIQHWDSPGHFSILEDSSISVAIPMSQVFNNLMVYDQQIPENSIETIRPELAESWSWNADGTALTLKLRSGVKWHDGKPFTSADVKCTFDLLLDKAASKLRINPRGGWFWNVRDVSTNGAHEATIHLGKPQPALPALLAAGFSAVYPCHVPPAQMRRHPIGTGPFKFVESVQATSIKLARNPDYWKPQRPYLDGIEYVIIPSLATAQLAIAAGRIDVTFPFTTTLPLMDELKAKYPDAQCRVAPTNSAPFVQTNGSRPPFDNPDVRTAVSLVFDRQAMIDLLSGGKFDIGGMLLPGPEGRWSYAPEQLRTVPGYEADLGKRRDAARALMRKAGYGPDKRLKLKLPTRNVPSFRDPAVLVTDQRRDIWIDAELELVETALFAPKLMRGDYEIVLSHVGNAIDDPDQSLFETYSCQSKGFARYCDKETDEMILRQSAEPDAAKRKAIVLDIDRRMQSHNVRSTLYWQRAATCWRPEVKGVTVGANSIYNSWRMEDWWLDR